MALRLHAMQWGLLAVVLVAAAEAAVLRGHLRNLSHGIEASNASIPRGGGQAVCKTWADSKIREERFKPYIVAISGGSVPEKGIFDELDSICAIPMQDPQAYKALHDYIGSHRAKPAVNPFSHSYYNGQADEVKVLLPKPLPPGVRILDYGCGSGVMLSVFHRTFKVPAENLHCIEVYDMVPAERKSDFQLHVLKDPIADLERLSRGSLNGYFDAVSSFAVLHHIPDQAVRTGVFSSIAAMMKPKAVFMLADWGSYGKPIFDVWYDVAHVLLWLFTGSAPPAGPVDIGTRYGGLSTYIELAAGAGLSPQKKHSSSRDVMDASPLGHFAQVFRKSTFLENAAQMRGFANTSKGNATHSEGVTHAMPLG